jgi:hypothetical protein
MPSGLLFRVSLALLATLSLSATAEAEEKLVNANLAAQTDSQGYRWDLTQQGWVNNGTSYTFNRAMVLSINGAQFNPSERLMKPDKSVFVFRGVAGGGLKIERRIKLDLAKGTVRFVDIVTNPGRKATTVILKHYTRLARSCDQLISNLARNAANSSLKEKEQGFFAYYKRRSPSVLFNLVSPRGGVRPSVQVLSRRTFHFSYVIKVPARRSRAIVTTLGQIKLGQTPPDKKTGRTFFESLNESKYVADVPARYRRVLVNFESVEEGGGEGVSLLGGVEDFVARQDLKRDKQDAVIVDERETMRGDVKGGEIKIKSAFGPVSVPFSDLLFWRGGAGVGYPNLLVFRNGEIVRGEATCPDLRLVTKTGVEIPLAPSAFMALVMRKGSEPEPTPSPNAKAVLRTHDGSVLLLGSPEGAFGGLTPWGTLKVDLARVVSLRYGLKEYPGLTVALQDGTSLPVVPSSRTLRLESPRFGQIDVPLHRILKLKRLKTKTPKLRKGGEIKIGHATLVGGAQIVGTLDLEKIELVTKTGTSSFDRDQVASLHLLESEGARPVFELKLHSKERFEGRLRQDRLPIKTTRARRDVPSADLKALYLPKPEKASDEKAPDEKSGEDKDKDKDKLKKKTGKTGDF